MDVFKECLSYLGYKDQIAACTICRKYRYLCPMYYTWLEKCKDVGKRKVFIIDIIHWKKELKGIREYIDGRIEIFIEGITTISHIVYGMRLFNDKQLKLMKKDYYDKYDFGCLNDNKEVVLFNVNIDAYCTFSVK